MHSLHMSKLYISLLKSTTVDKLVFGLLLCPFGFKNFDVLNCAFLKEEQKAYKYHVLNPRRMVPRIIRTVNENESISNRIKNLQQI